MIPDSMGYRTMTEYFTDVNAVTARDMRTTFHGYNPAKNPDEHIDYCFTDKNIEPINQKIIDETVEGKYPSDHYGLYIELDLF